MPTSEMKRLWAAAANTSEQDVDNGGDGCSIVDDGYEDELAEARAMALENERR